MPTIRTCLSHYAAIALLGSGGISFAQSDPNRGLWVGEVRLSHANEVTVPLDANNNPIAPNPAVATPTFDDANLRLILHVNGSGQVSLLRDVAIVRRRPGDLSSENDISLLTDERLFGEFPPQAAQRIASAVFDFGDARATAAVDAVVDAAIDAAFPSINALSQAQLDTAAEREAAEAAAYTTAKAATDSVIPTADALSAFDAFLTSEFNLGAVDALAASQDATALRTAATALTDDSFYADERGTEMVDQVLAAITSAAPGEEQNAARAAAAAFADTTNEYQRFIAGAFIGDLISSATDAAATASGPLASVAIDSLAGTPGSNPVEITATAHGLQNGGRVTISGSTLPGLNGTHIVMSPTANTFEIDIPFAGGATPGRFTPVDALSDAINNDPTGFDTEAEALRIQVAAYSDTRAVTAIETIRAAMIAAAESATADAGQLTDALRERRVRDAAFAAGLDSLANDIPRFALPSGAPSGDYTEFVRSDSYAESTELAARAVAAAMVEEQASNILATPASVRGQGRAAAFRALESVYSAAARSSQTTLDMQDGAVGGGFGAGNGDTRLTAALGAGEVLDGPALTASLVLPASHPTNPFRHRRHPDHTRGFDIRREIRIDFDAADPSPNPRAGFGVSNLSGVFREEIFGLHKPLGPNPETEPIGLRVEGTFQLFRISQIDTLDAR